MEGGRLGVCVCVCVCVSQFTITAHTHSHTHTPPHTPTRPHARSVVQTNNGKIKSVDRSVRTRLYFTSGE